MAAWYLPIHMSGDEFAQAPILSEVAHVPCRGPFTLAIDMELLLPMGGIDGFRWYATGQTSALVPTGLPGGIAVSAFFLCFGLRRFRDGQWTTVSRTNLVDRGGHVG